MCPNLPLPRAATCGSQTPVEALQIADMRSYVLAPLDLKSHRVFDNMLTTAAAERESPAPAPSCDDSTRVQPWTGYLSHGSLHGIKAHTKASEVAPTQSAYSRVAVYNNSTRAESAHGGGTPTLGRRIGRGCRWCRMVVGGGHLSSRQYHSLQKKGDSDRESSMVHHCHNEAEIRVRGYPLGYGYAGSVMAGLQQAPQAVWLAWCANDTIAPCLFSPGTPCSADCRAWSG